MPRVYDTRTLTLCAPTFAPVAPVMFLAAAADTPLTNAAESPFATPLTATVADGPPALVETLTLAADTFIAAATADAKAAVLAGQATAAAAVAPRSVTGAENAATELIPMRPTGKPWSVSARA